MHITLHYLTSLSGRSKQTDIILPTFRDHNYTAEVSAGMRAKIHQRDTRISVRESTPQVPLMNAALCLKIRLIDACEAACDPRERGRPAVVDGPAAVAASSL